MLLGMIFQVFEALTEKADRPNSVDLDGTTQLPLAEALVCLILLGHSDTNSFNGGGARFLINAIH